MFHDVDKTFHDVDNITFGEQAAFLLQYLLMLKIDFQAFIVLIG